MKRTFLTVFVLIIFTTIFISSCEDAHFLKGELTERTSYLYLNYWNPDSDEDDKGDLPQIELNADQSSKSIKIDFTKAFRGDLIGSSQSQIIIDNMRIADEYGNFEIKSIQAEEFKNNVWQAQSVLETPVEFSGVQSLDVVLVLDASGSMQPNFTTLKTSAKQFIDAIKRNIPGAKFGIVSFTNDITKLDITGDAETVKTFIDNMVAQGNITRLYQGISDGIELLKTSTAESKVMVTFTDGVDNEDILTPEDVIALLEEESEDLIKIQSYAIGLRGDVDIQESVLSSMCIRGFALFPKNQEEMNEFFNYFSKVVSTVYNLTYTRSSNEIPKAEERKIRFKIECIQK